MKTLSLKFYGKTYHLAIDLDHYRADNSLAISLVDSKTFEPFDTITVCLPGEHKPYQEEYVFIDTNNCSWAIDFIVKNGLGTQVNGWYGKSGFCQYPLFKMDMEKLKEFKAQ